MDERYGFDETGKIISRRCIRCKMMKSLDLFHKDCTRRSGVTTICRLCRKKRDDDLKKSGYTAIVYDHERTCTKCGKLKPVTDFPLNGIHGRQKTCKTCKQESYKKYRKDHLGEVRNKERKKNQVKSEGNYNINEWNILLDLCGRTCVFCGRGTPEVEITADHIIPISRGGTNYIWNIQPACRSCNSGKGNREARDLRPEAAIRYFSR